MVPPTNRRMPLSCEPCRARKIRCTPNRSPPGPCGSCQRRGVLPSKCVFMREGNQSHNVHGQFSSNEELLTRIRNLEDLLHGHIRAFPSPNQPLAAPTLEISPNGLDSSEPFLTQQPTPSSLSLKLPRLAGHLHVSDSGHVRYEPRSVYQDSSTATVARSLDPAYGVLSGCMPFETMAACSKDDLLALLPPTRQCNELKTVFFKVFSPLFHILHDPTFEADYEHFQRNPESMSPSWLALLFAVLSIAVTALDDGILLRDLGKKSSNSLNIATLSSRYRTAAMQCLMADHYLWRHTLYTLQALVLLLYGINHTHGQTWALLGATYNIALAIGCHIDPAEFGLDIIQCEERRRCWAGLSMLYTIHNISMGSLDTRCLPTDVALPADVNDIDLMEGRSISNNSSPTQMSYLLHKFSLYNLCHIICKELFVTRQSNSEWVISIDQEIANEQDKWNAKYQSDAQSGSLALQHVVQVNILNGYAYQLFLLLHRPVLMNVVSPTRSEEIRRSRNRCIESAQALLDIHTLLFESIELKPFSWYNQGLGSFHAFHAAVFLFVAIATSENPDQYHDIRQTLEKSMTIFEAMADRSRICEQATPILHYLHSNIAVEPRQDILNFTDAVAVIEYDHMDVLLDRLQPQQWLSPGAMTWEDWGFAMDGAAV